MKKIYSWFGGRRYFFAQQVFVIAVILRCFKRLDVDGFVTLVVWTIGLYVGGNVLQKISEGKNGKGEKREHR